LPWENPPFLRYKKLIADEVYLVDFDGATLIFQLSLPELAPFSIAHRKGCRASQGRSSALLIRRLYFFVQPYCNSVGSSRQR
jgi:hypothetical protein